MFSKSQRMHLLHYKSADIILLMYEEFDKPQMIHAYEFFSIESSIFITLK